MTTQKFFDHGDIMIFVDSDEVQTYRQVFPDIEIISTESNGQGIGYARMFILNYMRKLPDCQRFIMSDDDLMRIMIRKTGMYKQFEGRKTTTDKYCDENPYVIVRRFDELLSEYACCSIPMKGFARLMPDRVKVNSSVMFTFVGYNLSKFSVNFDPSIRIWEDIDFTIQVLLEGGDIACDYHYAHVFRHKFSGGCEDERRRISEEMSAKKLRDKWGDLVTAGGKRDPRPRFSKILQLRKSNEH